VASKCDKLTENMMEHLIFFYWDNFESRGGPKDALPGFGLGWRGAEYLRQISEIAYKCLLKYKINSHSLKSGIVSQLRKMSIQCIEMMQYSQI
jgi:hypothetical protein